MAPKVQPLSLRREDMPDLSTGERVDRLFRELNRFAEQVTPAVNDGMVVKDLIIIPKPDWIAVTPQAAWTANATVPPMARRFDYEVTMEGLMDRNAALSGSQIGTVPSGMEPSQTHYFATTSLAEKFVCELKIQTDGKIYAYFADAPTSISLDGVRYEAKTTQPPRANAVFPHKFKHGLPKGKQPIGVMHLGTWDQTYHADDPTSHGTISWRSVKDEIWITDIDDLVAHHKYLIRIAIIAG